MGRGEVLLPGRGLPTPSRPAQPLPPCLQNRLFVPRGQDRWGVGGWEPAGQTLLQVCLPGSRLCLPERQRPFSSRSRSCHSCWGRDGGWGRLSHLAKQRGSSLPHNPNLSPSASCIGYNPPGSVNTLVAAPTLFSVPLSFGRGCPLDFPFLNFLI